MSWFYPTNTTRTPPTSYNASHVLFLWTWLIGNSNMHSPKKYTDSKWKWVFLQGTAANLTPPPHTCRQTCKTRTYHAVILIKILKYLHELRMNVLNWFLTLAVPCVVPCSFFPPNHTFLSASVINAIKKVVRTGKETKWSGVRILLLA